jgi:ATP-dependent Clp protease ATP-binding subunit ClpC
MSEPMQPEDFGESGLLALHHAREIAVELRSNTITTAHLFLGVVALEDAILQRRFSREGVDLNAIAGLVRERLAAGEGEESFARTEAALAEAARAASAQANPLIEAPHVLIGVLRDVDGVVVRTLREAGADTDKLDKELWAMLAQGEWSADPYKGRRAIQQPGIGTPSKVLESLGRDLTEAAQRGELNPIIGREQETRELVEVLCGMRKHNAVLIGDAGVGKTAIVEGLAQRIVDGEVPDQLTGMTIRTIEIGSLVAGTMYRGMFEERLKRLVDEARGREDLILFIDEMHTLVGAGRAEGVRADAADYLKPALTEGKLKVIGATTTEEFRAQIEQDKALMRRFQQVVVDEPSRKDTLTVLRGLEPRYEEFHGVEIADEALEAAIDLSARYMHERFLPDKALDLLDRACTHEKLAAGMVRWMPALAGDADEGGEGKPTVDAEDIAEVVSILLEIPIQTLTSQERTHLLDMGEALKQRVVGQDEAVHAVARAILAERTMRETERDKDPERPIGVFLFLGPTGVGKTRLAQEVAAYMFGDDDQLIRLDMSEFAEPHTVSRLLGATPPYQGWEAGGRLTNAVRSKPYSVVLLDEFEKAHPDVWNVFLQAFDAGHVTDGAGRFIDFRNTVIVMTSNVGARQIQASRPIGFVLEAAEKELRFEDVKREVERELHRVFPPEFLNRIDEPLVFRPLSKDSLRGIVGLVLDEMVPLELELSEDAVEFLVEQSYDPVMGARPVRRAIQRLLRYPLSLMLAREEISDEMPIAVGIKDGELTFEAKATEPADTEQRAAV